MPCPSHYFLFHHPHNIVWGVQIIKLYFMEFSPLPCYLVPFRTKYSHIPLAYFFSQCKRPRFTPILNNRQNYSSV
jgi:hypothetical protein